MSDTVGGRVTGSDAEGPVTVPEGTGAGVARLSKRDRAQVRSAGEARSDSKAAAAASRSRFSRRHTRDRCFILLFFLGGEPVGVEETGTEMEAEGSELMTASTGS